MPCKRFRATRYGLQLVMFYPIPKNKVPWYPEDRDLSVEHPQSWVWLFEHFSELAILSTNIWAWHHTSVYGFWTSKTPQKVDPLSRNQVFQKKLLDPPPTPDYALSDFIRTNLEQKDLQSLNLEKLKFDDCGSSYSIRTDFNVDTEGSSVRLKSVIIFLLNFRKL